MSQRYDPFTAFRRFVGLRSAARRSLEPREQVPGGRRGRAPSDNPPADMHLTADGCCAARRHPCGR